MDALKYRFWGIFCVGNKQAYPVATRGLVRDTLKPVLWGVWGVTERMSMSELKFYAS